MQYWNGVIVYASQLPDAYVIPGTDRCIFRVMHEHCDAHAWNLYWLSKPDTDCLLTHRDEWFRFYNSLSVEETRAFYEALDTPVWHRQTLASIVSQPPKQAIRLLRRANLAKTRFYSMFGGEQWRQTMLGRLFLVERGTTVCKTQPEQFAPCVVHIDFSRRRTA